MYYAPRVHGRNARVGRNPRFAFLLAVPTVLALTGCDAASAISAEELPTSIQLSRSAVDFATADTTRLEAVLLGASGRPIASPSAGQAKPGTAGPAVSWQSSDRNVVEVSRSGLLQARGAGEATIIASSGNLRAQADVKVKGNQRSVVLSPKVDTLTYLGASSQLDAALFDASGKRVGGNISWASNKPDIVTVDGKGRVSALAVGVALITATASSSVDTARVVVRQVPAEVEVAPGTATADVGETKQFHALAVDAGGTEIPDASISWSSSDTKVATVDSRGVVAAKGAGKASIRATAEGVSESAGITVAGTSTDTSPPSSPAPGTGDLYPNQPSGFASLSDRPFARADEEGWTVRNSRLSIVAAPSGPQSPSTTGQMVFDSRMSPGGSPSSTRGYFDARREIYIAFWLRISENYIGSPQGVSKILYAANRLGATCSQKSSFYNALTGQGENGFPLTAFSQDTEVQPGRRFSPNLKDVRIQRGQWHFVEHLVTANTPGVLDGEIHTWVDGVKTMQYRDVGWVQHSSSCSRAGEWLMAEWVPVWGRHGNEDDAALLTSHGPFYQWIDHLYISGR